MSKIIKAEAWAVSLPYAEAKFWTIGGSETESHYVALRLGDEAGRSGAAEVVCKPAWNGATQGVLLKACEEMGAPMIAGADAGDHKAGAKLARSIAGPSGLQVLLDNAWRDLNWGGLETAASVENSTVLNRDEPAKMAAAARRSMEETGTRVFKIKTGQGLDLDRAAITAIKAAVGDGALLTADANSAYKAADVLALDAMLADLGVVFSEDPCSLGPDAAAEKLIRAAKVPLLIDKPGKAVDAVRAFLDRGATHYSIKPTRMGLTEAEAVADMVDAICIGTSAEAPLGALVQMRLAAGLKRPETLISAELDFHRELADGYLIEPLVLEGGRLHLPAGLNAAACVDWQKLGRLAHTHLALPDL